MKVRSAPLAIAAMPAPPSKANFVSPVSSACRSVGDGSWIISVSSPYFLKMPVSWATHSGMNPAVVCGKENLMAPPAAGLALAAAPPLAAGLAPALDPPLAAGLALAEAGPAWPDADALLPIELAGAAVPPQALRRRAATKAAWRRRMRT